MNGNNGDSKHGGDIAASIRAYGGTWSDWLDFSANINPEGLCEAACEAILDALPHIVHYPEPDSCTLRQAIAQTYAMDPSMVTVGNGAAELFYLACNSLRPSRALIPAPAFSEYARAASAAGAEVMYLPMSVAQQSFTLPIEEILAQLQANDMLFIGHPNNPTGTLVNKDELVCLADAVENRGAWLVVDESFLDFCAETVYSAKELLRAGRKRCIVIHSLTKFFAVPGLRLGFSVTTTDLAQKLANGKDPWNVNLFAQAAGMAILSDVHYQVKSRQFVQSEKNWLAGALADIPGIRVHPPAVNFILLDVAQTGWTVGELCHVLASDFFIMIRNCGNYPHLGDQYIRVAVKTRTANERLVEALKVLLSNGRQV